LQDQRLGSNQPKGYTGSNPSRWLCDGRCRGVAGEVAALGELPWRRHGRSSSAKPSPRYGAPSWTGFLPTGAVGLGELTRGVFSRRGAPEQGVRQRGSSSDLRRRWWGASRGSSQRGWAKQVGRKLQSTDVGLLELEKLLTRHGDEKGYLGLASVFLKILARGHLFIGVSGP
jgi:hypothetical protein